MADNPPPPPPPHGANPKSTSGGLPEGNYDIFIIPPHSAGSGFLYLPSLQPNVNSFAAGFASAVFCYLVWITAIPALGQWLSIIAASGSAGVLLLVAGVGAVAWAFGKSQGESKSQGTQGPPPSGDEDHGTSGADGGSKHSRTHSGPYNTSHSSGSANAHSAPPPRTPQQDYTTPPPRQEYRAPPHHSLNILLHLHNPTIILLAHTRQSTPLHHPVQHTPRLHLNPHPHNKKHQSLPSSSAEAISCTTKSSSSTTKGYSYTTAQACTSSSIFTRTFGKICIGSCSQLGEGP
ncbi:unnamed protein product [Aureobasidium pullulans]|nr:unnamed protein product [Aureobasidium pullulans]